MQKFWFNGSLYYDKIYAYRISHHTLQMTNTKINSSESTGSQKGSHLQQNSTKIPADVKIIY